MYMSEFCCYVMLNFWRRSPAIYPWNPDELGTRDWPSRNWNRRSLLVAAPKSLVHVEWEKLLENYLGEQGTFKICVCISRLGLIQVCIVMYMYICMYHAYAQLGEDGRVELQPRWGMCEYILLVTRCIYRYVYGFVYRGFIWFPQHEYA